MYLIKQTEVKSQLLHMLTNNMAINLKTSPAAIKAALWQAHKEHFWRECLTIFARV